MNLRRILLIIGAVAIVAIAGVLLLRRTPPNANSNQTTASEIGPIDVPIRADTDADGLSDSEEVTLGTDAKDVDTDNDGLSDREEVKVYNTDPKKADTDGDGFSDGDEVRRGFNPAGPGDLLPSAQAIKNTNASTTNATP